MPYAGEHMLLQWGGTFRAGANTAPGFEQFVGSLRFRGGSNSGSTGQDVCNSLSEALKTAWARGNMFIPTNCFLEFVKWNPIGINGRYSSDGNTVADYFPGIPGTKEAVYPTQIAWATTWETGFSRGRAARGRTYWPTAVGIDPLRATTFPANAQTMADAMVDLLGVLNSITRQTGNGTMVAAVMSNVGAGTTHDITGAKVGVRLDIQRRRANKITEAYKTGTDA